VHDLEIFSNTLQGAPGSDGEKGDSGEPGSMGLPGKNVCEPKKKKRHIQILILNNHRVALETMVILVQLVSQDQGDCLEKQ
jgi:hypothetical protein